jgi:eukaryotic-like serine/threonine-protein kinase
MIHTASGRSQSGSVDRIFADLVEDVTAKLQAGEPVDIEALASEHPEYAEKLRQLLPALEVLDELSRSGTDRSPLLVPSDVDAAAVLGTLGDFHIAREIGRGGMGVVYEAEQVSLGRRVALKVLPFLAVLDNAQIQRFKNEARAAGQLHHTNIVPVYAVGCERGVHYYAMQFIEGQTLAQVIADCGLRIADLKKESRDPSAPTGTDAPAVPSQSEIRNPKSAMEESAIALTPPIAGLSTEGSARSPEFMRTVARLGIQAAEALDHAHESGIVHRDIKPSNLLLGRQGQRVDHRFRPGPVSIQHEFDHDGRPRRHAALHEPGASAGQARGDRWTHRCVFPRRDALRAIDPAAGLLRARPTGVTEADRV